jgi:hypothetical protein
MEVVSWLELQAGTYSMIVNSDDGFRVTVGKEARDKATALVLGEYDGGRGASEPRPARRERRARRRRPHGAALECARHAVVDRRRRRGTRGLGEPRA